MTSPRCGPRTRRRRGVAAVAAAAALLTPPGVPAAASSDPLPRDRAVEITGGGWGHGRGMGQWGARGMAEQGRTWQQILNHYYTGISIGTRDAEQIRPLVKSGPSIVVTSLTNAGTAAVPFTVRRGTHTGPVVWTTTSARPYVRVRPSSGRYRVERGASATGPWELVTDMTEPAVLVPGTALLEVVYGTQSGQTGTICFWKHCILRGRIHTRISGSQIHAVNYLSVENYLYGVVPREMPAGWPMEGLKAQATAARSYALFQKLSRRAAGIFYDVASTTADQVYSGRARRGDHGRTREVIEHSRTNAAVDATKGRVMRSGGNPIFAQYSSSTGGHTAPGAFSYLAPVPDPADAISSHHRWTARVTVRQIEDRWPGIGRLTDIRVAARDGHGPWGGRIESLDLVGTQKTERVTGSAFRFAFAWSPASRPDGIRSTLFFFEPFDLWPRIAGADRIATAIEASRDTIANNSVGAVVLARADDFADALTGIPLALRHGGPLLLTASDHLDPRVRDEIERILLAGSVVYLLGGEQALAEEVAAELDSMGHTVRRLAGGDRFGTAIAVARDGLSDPSVLVLATGLLFPDAVAAGAAAAAEDGAVLLTRGSEMPGSLRDYLDERVSEAEAKGDSITRYAVGGPAATADPDAEAVSGPNRYATAVEVAKRFFSKPPAVGLASGEDFPDALSGGVHIMRAGPGPLLLSRPDRLSVPVRNYIDSVRNTLEGGFVYGGESAIRQDVRRAATIAAHG